MTAINVPKVPCDLPISPIYSDHDWKHLFGITLADPNFDSPGKVDILLGVEIFIEVIRQGRRMGPPGSPFTLETEFGCVIGGKIDYIIQFLMLSLIMSLSPVMSYYRSSGK